MPPFRFCIVQQVPFSNEYSASFFMSRRSHGDKAEIRRYWFSLSGPQVYLPVVCIPWFLRVKKEREKRKCPHSNYK